MAGPHTPVMQQHARAKRAHPDAIVFFRLGDFYEMFGEDAVVGARLLDLTLTARNKGKPDEIPMAGVPHHAAHQYISRLLELGHKVALCEQMADPSKVKGIVPREVVRVITPGLVTDVSELDRATNNWLAALEVDESGVGVALFDVSTGELAVSEVTDLAAVLAELSRAAPREVSDSVPATCLPSSGPSPPRFPRRPHSETTDLSTTAKSSRPSAPSRLTRPDSAHASAGHSSRALRFARRCTPGKELPLRRIGRWDPGSTLVIDTVAQRHLELVESWSGAKGTTLLSVIDVAQTAAGARLLRRRLLAPLTDVERIRRRLDLTELFVVHSRLREELRGALDAVTDLERLSVRAALGEATPRDLGAVRDGLTAAARALALLDGVEDREGRETLGISSGGVDVLPELSAELCRALVERPPAQPKEGGVFAPGFDSELDELESLKQSGTEQMVALEQRLRESTGIPTLKLRYTRVFGWYMEVSRTHASRAPSEWRRKQTVASGERYTSTELDELADRITHAEERHRERELLLIRSLVSDVARERERLGDLAERLARWDVAATLAEIAHRHDYTRPLVDDSDELSIEDGRHPVVERMAARGRFVPNDVRLDLAGERLWLVTGPNMAGKSTLLRQTALIVILAQLGSFVPAKRARVGVVDRVLSRVGASDDVARGESTFMVEMRETAEILASASARSLVILDEIGRGTSTFDGLAIAWAVAEHLDGAIGCRALFATHYHELTEFADRSEHAANHSVSAREVGDEVVFLHRLVPGPASRSYGIAVARLAGLPESVLARAKAILASLESDDARGRKPVPQLDLFERAAERADQSREVLDTLRAVEIERLTPLEALSLLARLKERL